MDDQLSHDYQLSHGLSTIAWTVSVKKSAAMMSTRIPSRVSIRITTRMLPKILSHGFTNRMDLLSCEFSITWTSYHVDSL